MKLTQEERLQVIAGSVISVGFLVLIPSAGWPAVTLILGLGWLMGFLRAYLHRQPRVKQWMDSPAAQGRFLGRASLLAAAGLAAFGIYRFGQDKTVGITCLVMVAVAAGVGVLTLMERHDK